MKNTEFVNRVLEIAASNPTYRTGGDGSDGTCDCIGLIMGALGGKFDMHSSNWFARKMTLFLEPLDPDTYEPELGDLVYKARNPNNPKYDLHERYVTGRYATDDLNDYYHVGTVTKVAPLEITHCTSTNNLDGIACDNTLDGWAHVGLIKGVEYVDASGDVANDTVAHDLAVVYAENGKPVKMRPIPSTSKPYIAEVPVGAQVEITEQADGWAKVMWNGQRGYMMTEFLRVIGMVEAEPETVPAEGYAITLSASAAAELLAALQKAGVG